ncbi:MAG: MerR family transcriptional regulator [Eubacteriales bacterium]|nr:MerR family transcriptional regulator [Eubacteriales bacterium]
MTISEVSRKYGLTQDTLRYYERVGIIPPVHRASSGLRDYTEEDCSWVELAKCMRSAGLQVEAIARYVSLAQQGDETISERRDLLIEQRKQLKEQLISVQEALKRLDYKISRYDAAVKEGFLSWD